MRYSLGSYLFVIALIGCLAFPIHSAAQQPLHTSLGHEGILNGIEIYGITQDENRMLWLSTSNGIYSTDGIDFTNYKSESVQTQEFFRPCFTASNTLYFTDIIGNIYRFKDGEIEYFKSIDFDQSYIDVSLFTSGEFLFTTSKDSLYRIDSMGNTEAIFGYSGAFDQCQIHNQKFSGPFTVYTKNRRESIKINQGNYTIYTHQNPLSVSAQRQVITDRNQVLLINGMHGIDDVSQLGPSLIDHHGSLWTGFRDAKGINYRGGNGSFNRIFNTYYINALLEDRDGNIWLGTRNNGLLTISNPKHFTIRGPEVSLVQSTHQAVYSISHNTAVRTAFSNEVANRTTLTTNSVKYLFTHHFKDEIAWIITSDSVHQRTNGNLVRSSALRIPLIKNHRWKNDTLVMLATIKGAFEFNPYRPMELKRIGKGDNRTSDLLFIEEKQAYLVSRFNGAELLDASGYLIRSLKNKHSKLNIAYMFRYGDKIMAVGSLGQIYRIDIANMTVALIHKAPTNSLTDCVFAKNYVYIIDKQRVYEYSIKQNAIRPLPIPIARNVHITEGSLLFNHLWMASNIGIIHYDLAELKNSDNKPTLQLNMRLDIEGEELPSDMQLKHTQNFISFNIKSANYTFPGLNTMEYRLLGLETKANTTGDHDIISYKGLKPGKYIFQVVAKSPLGALSPIREISFRIARPWYKTYAAFSSYAVVALLMVWLIYFITVKRIRVKDQLIRRTRAAQINTLMAQMNPHFIFNCLNSIQDLILKEDIRGSMTYLGKFSNLTRTTMENSRMSEIPLSEELEQLKLYLDLELLRFKDLHYSLEISLLEDQVDLYNIPPLLIQPFVENALKHGLLHSSYEKRLLIKVKEVDHDLVIQIYDNGIGRPEALKIKQRQSKIRSFSGGAIARRIDLINSQGQYKVALKIQDLDNEDNTNWSTLVELRFINFDTHND